MEKGKTLALIDGSSLLHRAYYALPPLTTASGLVTNAAYGFTMMLNRLRDEFHPEHIICTFDRPAPTFRHQAYEAYKAHRPKMPDDLRPQVGLTEEILDAYGIPVVAMEGYEGDDILGTLAKAAVERGWEALIFTGDRDTLQLVGGGVKTVLTRKGITSIEVWDEEVLQREYQLTPAQMIELKALMGDASDNIPGVAGIGEKTALLLIQKYGNLESLYQHLDELTARQKNLLETGRESAFLSRELATINCRAPLEIDLGKLPEVNPEPRRLYELFVRLEFRTLAQKILEQHPELASSQAHAGEESVVTGQAPVSAAVPPVPVEIPENEDSLGEALGILTGSETAVILPFLDGPAPMTADLLGLAVLAGGRCFYFPLGLEGEARDRRIMQALRDWFQAKNRSWTGYDLKAALLALSWAWHGHGLSFDLPRVGAGDFDILVAAYLADPSRGNASLDEAALHLGYALPLPPAFMKEKGWAQTLEFRSRERIREIGEYLGTRAAALSAMRDQLLSKLESDELLTLFREVEMPLVRVLAEMELRGVAVDVRRLGEMSLEMGKKIDQLAAEIFREAGQEFNINSPKQLGTVLFDHLGLPRGKKTKTGYSTGADVLEAIAEDFPIVDKILAYRQWVKLKTTYADALKDMIDTRTGRIHTTFNQTVTATGRLSSANPNLQNIPIRTEEGGRLREVFIAEKPGYSLLSADYSQIELRVLAHISGDPTLIEAFRHHEDIHTRTAAEVFGVQPGEVTLQMRSAAKAVNFGIVYGISSFGLAKGTGLGRNEAQAFIDRYLARYPKVKEYMDQIVADAREKGYVTTLLGRRRYLPDLHSRNFAVRSFAERTALNTPIQGSAADIIKIAMLRADQALKEKGFQTAMILQVHDELVFEGPDEEMKEAAAIVRECMEQAMDLAVPLDVEIKVGKNWREGEAYA